MDVADRPSDRALRVAVVADSDSRWKWGAALATRLTASQHVSGILLDGPAAPSEQQLRDLGDITVGSVRRASMARTLATLTDTDADVVVLACVGGGVQAVLQGLARAWRGNPDRPVVVTGYVGLVYERIVDGLVLRAGADVVLANSTDDAQRFREVFAGLGLDPDVVVPAALPFLGDAPYAAANGGTGRPYTVTFVAQPTVPETRVERQYALEQAIAHAVCHPQRRVLVKLRARVGERTTHAEPYHYAALHNGALPPNVEFVYGSMADVLERTDLCVTISSTAALEAMHRGIPTAVLVDFGIREALGNHVFLGSGVMTSWQRLHDGDTPVADPGWLARNGVRGADPWEAVATHIASLAARHLSLDPLVPWLTTAGAVAYLPDLLGRYGLGPDGRALDAPTGDLIPLHRRAMRASARHAYRVGVRAIEPRIRRMAQL